MSLCRFVFWLSLRFIRVHGWWGQWFSTVETLRSTEPIPCLRDHDRRCIWPTFIGEKLLLSYYAFQFICIKLGEVSILWDVDFPAVRDLEFAPVQGLNHVPFSAGWYRSTWWPAYCALGCSNVFHIPIWSLETALEKRHDYLAENSVSAVS